MLCGAASFYHGQTNVDVLLDGLTQEAGAIRHPAAAALAVLGAAPAEYATYEVGIAA